MASSKIKIFIQKAKILICSLLGQVTDDGLATENGLVIRKLYLNRHFILARLIKYIDKLLDYSHIKLCSSPAFSKRLLASH